MGKGTHKSKYKVARDKAEKFYFKKWRNKEKIAPAFSEVVYISRAGWDHIVFQKKRSKAEQLRRLEALPLAKKLLETATTYQEHRSKSDTHYFAIVGFIERQRIKVVVRSKGKSGKKFLYSVIVLR